MKTNYCKDCPFLDESDSRMCYFVIRVQPKKFIVTEGKCSHEEIERDFPGADYWPYPKKTQARQAVKTKAHDYALWEKEGACHE